MKCLILLTFVGLAVGQFHLQPPQRRFQTIRPYRPVYQRGRDALATSLKHNFDITADGTYQYNYETENGITAEQSGYVKNVAGSSPQAVQGTFSWTSPEGEFISFGYTADENGYHPYGNALPTPPPIPDYILRSIEFNKAEEEKRNAKKRFF